MSVSSTAPTFLSRLNLKGWTPGWQTHLAIFACSVLVIISRRPDVVTHAQFFGEDGAIWFSEAFRLGWWHALSHSQNGYFQTLPRLAAALALLVPLASAPLIMNLIGLIIQALPVNVLLSKRSEPFGPIGLRMAMSAAYLALPNTSEVNVAAEEAQWHLALLACLVVLAVVPGSWWWKAFDIGVLAMCGATGPFCLALAPIAAIQYWHDRKAWRSVNLLLLAGSALLQLTTLVSSAAATRPKVGLGATPTLFVRLLAGRVYLGALIGEHIVRKYEQPALLALVAALGTAVILYCAWKAKLEWKLYILFSFLIFGASLRSPMVSMTVPQWISLWLSPGLRYWFLPTLAFVWCLLWCVMAAPKGIVRELGVVLLLVLLIGIWSDWRYPAEPDLAFRRQADEFAALPPGRLYTFQILPAGWQMELAKRPAGCVTLPLGNIDSPVPNATLSDQVDAAGWISAERPVNSISLYMDGNKVTTVRPDFSRPDVDPLYPDSAVKDKGWGAKVNTAGLTPGQHVIRALAREADGCEAEFASVTVTR